ncbi:LysR family transcriptional regulator [Halomonas cupida]|uniref:DNA-binding transcriptional regulator, LysR family n=1 Tax=Halomonas cupida TaxID=44933 RepID=A0A1M7I7D6_9GAMM|nr:LysR family transcriptional regulator [Halomonas cupida]GEN24057.1 LysR family transcriptional regulator [Halomonas cupida]SHM36654.1 DNA-binding transcriptional regulator, LysR family [Halomonas cupida]
MLPELKIQPLRYVLAIVDEGGFHAAARHLHRTQPALSMAVRELEQRLGEPIFEKGGKAMLTPFGTYCLPRFRELIIQHDRLSRDLVTQVEKRAGHIDMAAVPSVASRLMPRLLSNFIQHYPDLKVSLHDGTADFVSRLVSAGEVDLGLTSLWQVDEELDFQPLMRDAIGVVCRDDHPFAGREALDWQELQGQALIRNGTSRLLEGTEAELLLAQSDFYISNMISLTAMLVAGIGITTLPRLAFPEEYERLRFVPLATPHVERELGLLKPRRRSLSPAAQAMEAFIILELGE